MELVSLRQSGNGEIGIWEAGTGRRLYAINGHRSPALSVMWSPVGSQIVSASEDGTAKVWEAVSGEEVRTLRGHSDLIWSVAWSPDGTFLVTGSLDGTAKVWGVDPVQILDSLIERSAKVLLAGDGTFAFD